MKLTAPLRSTRHNREHGGRGYKVPNGALYSTVDDLARLIAFQASKTGVIVLRNASGGKVDVPGLTFRAITELANVGTPAR